MCACFSQRERGRSPGGGCKAFREQVWKLWHEWLKHSALELACPYSTGRTHCLHDGELSPSNTPLPVGNPNPHVPTSGGWSVPSHRHTLLPCCGWPWLLGWRGRQVCFPTACLWGWLGLPVGFSTPQIPFGCGGCPCVHQSIPSSTVLCGTCSFRRLPGSLLPCCPFGCSSCKL